MNKICTLLGLVMFSLMLVSCEDNIGTNEEERSENQDQEEDIQDEGTLTVNEIFGEALTTLDDAESFTVDVDFNQEGYSDDHDMDIYITQVLDMDLETSAMKIKATESYQSKSLDINEETDVTMYLATDEVFYMDSEIDKWLRFAEDDSEAVANKLVNEPDPLTTLGLLAEYVDDFEMEKTEGNYKLNLDLSGDDYAEVHDEIINSLVEADDTGRNERELEKTEIEDYKIELNIEQETFETVGIHLDMILHIDIRDDQSTIDQRMETEFSNYNDIDNLDVPEDVKDGAEDADELTIDKILE